MGRRAPVREILEFYCTQEALLPAACQSLWQAEVCCGWTGLNAVPSGTGV